ncbi:hypothetical protein Tco_0781023 [Tanacetum coccineum]
MRIHKQIINNPTSAVRNTRGRNDPQGLEEPMYDEVLRYKIRVGLGRVSQVYCRVRPSSDLDAGSCTRAREVMIFCTIKGKPLALPWGRTPRLDSGVRLSNRYGGSTVEVNCQEDVPCVLLGHGMGPDSNEVLDHEDGLGTVNGANDCNGMADNLNNNSRKDINQQNIDAENNIQNDNLEQVHWTQRRDKKEVSPLSSVESKGARKGVSDVYKEFYDVSSESNGIFQFRNNPRGETDSVKCNISMEHVKEVGELIGVSWIRTEKETKTENMVRTGVADSGDDGAMPQWLCMVKKNVKASLRTWSKRRFDNHMEKVKELRNEAMRWELEAENRNLNDNERKEWLEARKRWEDKEREKCNMMRQKARIKWDVEG